MIYSSPLITGGWDGARVDRPASPCAFALGSGARFIARTIDTALKHGEPMLFANGTKGLALDGLKLRVVDVVDGDISAVLVHDERNRIAASLLIDMSLADGFPVALGVIYCDPAPTFEAAVVAQNAAASAGKVADLDALIRKGQSWEVAGKALRAE